MRYLIFLFAGLCTATPALAFDQTTDLAVRSSYITSKLTTTPFENKLLQAARDDAASFVASAAKSVEPSLSKHCAGYAIDIRNSLQAIGNWPKPFLPNK